MVTSPPPSAMGRKLTLRVVTKLSVTLIRTAMAGGWALARLPSGFLPKMLQRSDSPP